MKKAYSKPTAYIEELALAQQIASCGSGSKGQDNPYGQATAQDQHTCGFYVKGLHQVVFVDNNQGCKDKKVSADTVVCGVCYNTVNAGYNVFAS